MSNSLPESARTILEKIRAGFPLIEIISWEEDRVCEHLGLICMTEFDPPRHFTTWSVTEGFSDGADGPGKAKDDPLGALDYIIQNEEKRVFLLKDFHHYMRDDHIVRRLRDAHSALQDSDRCIILLGAVTTVPPELVKDVLVVDYDLPDVDEVGQIVETALWSMQTVDGEQMAIREGQRTQILRMFLGLTRDEIREEVSGVLCRCTGYEGIVRAIEEYLDGTAAPALEAAE